MHKPTQYVVLLIMLGSSLIRSHPKYGPRSTPLILRLYDREMSHRLV